MENTTIIERYGGVLKEEPLTCVENDLILKNTCVVEAVSPYFGFYNEVRSNTQPKMVYFILDHYFSLEDLVRATTNVQKKVSFTIDAVTGSITIHNQTCYVIRILNIDNYNHIKMLQQFYIDEGLQFKKKHKNFKEEMGIIKLRFFFTLNPIDEATYVDHNDSNIGYFKIPHKINWDDFKNTTTEVKADTDLLFFDASRAYMYEQKSITDMIKVYRENLTVENLKCIRDRYLKLIKQDLTH